MQLRIVLIGLGLAGPCDDLALALQRRRHQVTYLRHFGDTADEHSGAGQRTTICYTSPESLFRHHTGTLRQADLIIVGSDVPYRSAVTSWVLDQACGAVAYCEVGPSSGATAGQPPPGFDFYISCAAGHGAEQPARALEHFASGVVVPAL